MSRRVVSDLESILSALGASIEDLVLQRMHVHADPCAADLVSNEQDVFRMRPAQGGPFIIIIMKLTPTHNLWGSIRQACVRSDKVEASSQKPPV